jgi:hypothetical protein
MNFLGKKAIVGFTCFVIGVSSCFLFVSYRSKAERKTEIIEISNAYHRALASKDRQELETILADSIALNTRFEKSTVSRSDYIEGIKSDVLIIESMMIDNVSVTVSDDTAEFDCTMSLVFKTDNLKLIEHKAKYTYSYAKIDGQWKIVAIVQA